MREVGRGAGEGPGLDGATDLGDPQPKAGSGERGRKTERERSKESPFRSGHADPSARVMGEGSAKRTVTGRVH